jgi:hypothetical protein
VVPSDREAGEVPAGHFGGRTPVLMNERILDALMSDFQAGGLSAEEAARCRTWIEHCLAAAADLGMGLGEYLDRFTSPINERWRARCGRR